MQSVLSCLERLKPRWMSRRDASQKSQPDQVKVSSVPQCVTTFPVCLNKGDSQVSQGAFDARGHFQEVTPNAEYRSHSAGPHGNFFSLCWPGGKVERVRLAAEIIETLWIYDDVIEELPHSDATQEHANVRDTLLTGTEAPSRKSLIAGLFKDFANRLARLDEKGAPGVLGAIQSYLDTYDSQAGPFTTIAEFTEYRILNVGFCIMEAFMQWTTGLHLDEQEKKIARDFYLSSGRVMGLTNDLYSWTVERNERTERNWNAVPIVMAQYGLGEADALVFVKGLIVSHEQTTRRLGRELVGQGQGSPKMESYVEAMGLMLGGNSFWSATCPRYNPEVGEEKK
ncbi:terpenoid synthase [Xylariomycetidae sp. FL2044]|nr:terpenoid synthase [Xylariomycetidae sp. FL2044]